MLPNILDVQDSPQNIISDDAEELDLCQPLPPRLSPNQTPIIPTVSSNPEFNDIQPGTVYNSCVCVCLSLTLTVNSSLEDEDHVGITSESPIDLGGLL